MSSSPGNTGANAVHQTAPHPPGRHRIRARLSGTPARPARLSGIPARPARLSGIPARLVRTPAGSTSGPLRGLILTAAACAGSGLLVASCSSSASQSTHGSGAPGNAPVAARAAGSNGAFTANRLAALTGATNLAKLAPNQSIIYTANLTLRVKNVDVVTTQATNDVAAVGGYIANEQDTSQTGPGTLGQVTLELKVPVAGYHQVLAQLAGLGKHLSFSQQAQDVTQQVADVNSRVASAEAAIKQLRQLLTRAGNVGQLLSVQNEINVQESNLESLLAQQQSLAHETTYATVNLTLLGHHVPVPMKPKKTHRGLVAGLSTGWRALKAVVVWLLTALGTLLPFVAPVVVLGGIIYFGRRRITRRRTPPAAAPPATTS